jgi:hypothetical protein
MMSPPGAASTQSVFVLPLSAMIIMVAKLRKRNENLYLAYI